MAWTKIEEVTLSSSAASVTLGNGGTLPQTFKTLILLASPRTDRAAVSDPILVLPNASTSNLSARPLQGDGSAASSATHTNGRAGIVVGASATSNTFGNMRVDFPNYSSTTANKPHSSDAVSENNATEAYQTMTGSLWSDTTAITSIQLKPQIGTNFVSGSTFTLYGLA